MNEEIVGADPDTGTPLVKVYQGRPRPFGERAEAVQAERRLAWAAQALAEHAEVKQTNALQTKLESLTEALINIAIGFVINFIGNWFILPLVGFTTLTVKDNLVIGGLFTIVSVARQYAIRRWAQQYLRRAKVVTATYLGSLWKKFLAT